MQETVLRRDSVLGYCSQAHRKPMLGPKLLFRKRDKNRLLHFAATAGTFAAVTHIDWT